MEKYLEYLLNIMESHSASHKMSPIPCQRQNIDLDGLSHDAVWCFSCCELEIFYPLGGQKQTTQFCSSETVCSFSHIVAFINSVWLTVGSDKSLKKGSFLNCNLKNQELKLRRKDKCWVASYDLKDQIEVNG